VQATGREKVNARNKVMATVSEQNRNRDCVFGFGRHWIWTVADRVIANFGLVALGLGDHAVSRWKVHA